MSRFYRISIPVKPHIQKFFNTTEGSPIRSSDESFFWLTIRPYLIYKLNDDFSNKQRNRQVANLTGSIQLQLSINKVKTYGLQMRKSSIILINRLLDHNFGKELFWHVKKCEDKPGRYKGYKQAIHHFCQLYDIEIEQDITEAALLNIYQRQRNYYRKKIGAKKQSPNFRHLN